MKKIDLDKIYASLDAYTLAQYLGMEVKIKGEYKFIHCPGHIKRLGKPDNHASNCVLTDRGYHCFGCNKTVNMVDMVMEYTGCEYKEALQLLADAAGGIDFYISDERPSEYRIPFTSEELRVIGINSPEQLFFINKVLSLDDDDYASYKTRGCERLTQGRNGTPIIQQLQRQKIYNSYIHLKAEEAVAKYDQLIKTLPLRESAEIEKIYELFNVDGTIPPETFGGLKNALLKRRAIARKIARKTTD